MGARVHIVVVDDPKQDLRMAANPLNEATCDRRIGDDKVLEGQDELL
jgi:hypothetical protein